MLRWYDRHQRELPWRATDDPYSIWVSEIMLQQTQVVTVLPYYERFLKRFDSVESLASADESEVLKHWEGLGYYRRARQMHAAARKIMEVHGGVFPRQLDHILALPGIGRYTAGAIYSFAYNLPAPIVEANTQRLYARLLLIRQPLTERASQVKLWEFAEKIITPTQSRSINHAAMELGALLCQPKPQCERCPLTELCPTYAHRLQNQIPVAKPRIAYVDRHEAAVVIQNECGEYRLRKCGPDEWWSGLWDFPRLEIAGSVQSPSDLERIEAQIQARFGFTCRIESPLFKLRHTVTRHRITLHCLKAACLSDSKREEGRKRKRASAHSRVAEREHSSQNLNDSENWRWVSIEELDRLPLSASGRRVAKRLGG